MAVLAIRTDIEACELRRLARAERDGRVAARLLAIANAHAILVLDRAGWHRAGRLELPANLSLIHLPAYSPELNLAERVWQYMRENWLSHCVLDSYDAIVEACCDAWNRLIAAPGVLASLTNYPYLRRV